MTNSTTSSAAVNILDDLFAAYGSLVTLVSDNAKQFVSDEFEEFLQMSGLKYHNLSAPYCPVIYGAAKRNVQITKDALWKIKNSKAILRRNIHEFKIY